MSDDATPKNPTEPSSEKPAAAAASSAVSADSAPSTAGGSQTEPTAVQEGQATAEAPLAPLVARQERETTIASAIADSWGRDAWVHPDVEEHPAVRAIRERYPDAIVDIVRFRDETTIHVRAELLREVCAYLREHPRVRLDFLSDLTALDMLRLRESPRFDVVVQLYSLSNRTRLRLKAGVNDGEPVPSLVPLWNGANWWEREAYDMFGIVFDGHPNLRRILLADDWDDGFPLRKDYPLRGWSEFPVYNTERTVPRQRTRWTGRGQ